MIRASLLLTLGFTAAILAPDLSSEASAQAGYCCRDPWLVFNLRISSVPCPGNEAPGKCVQHYCLNADIDRAWRQRSGVFNCDAEGYNYQISEEASKDYEQRGRILTTPR